MMTCYLLFGHQECHALICFIYCQIVKRQTLSASAILDDDRDGGGVVVPLIECRLQGRDGEIKIIMHV